MDRSKIRQSTDRTDVEQRAKVPRDLAATLARRDEGLLWPLISLEQWRKILMLFEFFSTLRDQAGRRHTPSL
jgi:hypothetical protein